MCDRKDMCRNKSGINKNGAKLFDPVTAVRFLPRLLLLFDLPLLVTGDGSIVT